MNKTTTELLELIKKSSDITTYIKQASEDFISPSTLKEHLNKFLTEKNLKKSDIARLSGLERKYVYDIFAGRRIPSRDKLLAICFAMQLTIDEIQQLLKATGYPPLYARLERDSIILFALQQHLNLIDTNELLYDMKHPLLA